MDSFENIMTRKSIREYSSRPVSNADIEKILRAGMSGPSCVNARDWAFLVVKDKEQLELMADANGKYAAPLKNAPLGILICGDLSRAFKEAEDYWIIDGAIAAQNMILCAHGLGIGSVWLGTWPQVERVENQRNLFSLPDHIIPHSVIAFGYPDEDIDLSKPDTFEEDLVHYEKW
ncbi:nitroreductase family protein [Clostridium sp. C105KSO13]|uniref:nitroreductase family protein n=1 Tax=Clostridium sp. C105KSO13 TaxID=1776045 RepID=UPI0007407C56|nr:nitroreductase family protein [Clostridium sp. C105KSO13]CUX37961.1 FMN reductase [NAD(P)H] [Clostridium sp. C105KSO13]